MLLFFECATITDSVNLLAGLSPNQMKPDEAQLLKEAASYRDELRRYSNTEFLLGVVQSQAENIFVKKVIFDKYHKSQVDLMKIMVRLNKPCPFSYLTVLSKAKNSVNTASMSIKEQFACEMVLSRFITSTIYHLGGFSSFSEIISGTVASYSPKADLVSFNGYLQVALSYLKEAYAPLARLWSAYRPLTQLMGQAVRIPELSPDGFEAHKLVVECNLTYIMMEKLRLLKEYRKVKESAKCVYEKLLKAQTLLRRVQGDKALLDYFEWSLPFMQAYCLVNAIKDNEFKKVEEDYGYVKKEFKQMVVENLLASKRIKVIAKNLEALSQMPASDPRSFAEQLFAEIFVKFAEEVQYVFSVKTDNTVQLYKEVDAMTFESLWNVIPCYDLVQEVPLS